MANVQKMQKEIGHYWLQKALYSTIFIQWEKSKTKSA